MKTFLTSITLSVMAGFDPAIQAICRPRFLDGRVKPGHDEAAALEAG